jgi:CBS domain-containing protein
VLKIKDILDRKGSNVWTISPEATVFESLEFMAEKDIGALLVMHREKVVGVFSERDYARKVILKGKSSKETKVGELMTSPVYTITPEKDVEECMALMTKTRARHIPVMEGERLVGIVSIGDVVNAIISEQKVKIHDLENYIVGGDFVFSL